MRLKVLKILVLAAYLMALAAVLGAGLGQEAPGNIPAPPNVFSGKVFFRGSPAPDGVGIFLRVGEYQSNVARPGFSADQRPIVLTLNGEYSTLKAQPPDPTFFAQEITFYATIGFGDVQAQEKDVLIGGLRIETGYDLHSHAASYPHDDPHPHSRAAHPRRPIGVATLATGPGPWWNGPCSRWRGTSTHAPPPALLASFQRSGIRGQVSAVSYRLLKANRPTLVRGGIAIV